MINNENNELQSVFIALGSNLNNPIEHLSSALNEIDNILGVKITKSSKLYKTKPIGPDQPDIINAVIEIMTTLSPHDLLHQLQKIELAHHRERLIRFGARTLDLDILLFGDISMNDEILTIPHPRMHNRNFVLIPLCEIAPNLELPIFGLIKDLIPANNPDDYVIPLDTEFFRQKA